MNRIDMGAGIKADPTVAGIKVIEADNCATGPRGKAHVGLHQHHPRTNLELRRTHLPLHTAVYGYRFRASYFAKAVPSPIGVQAALVRSGHSALRDRPQLAQRVSG